MKEFIQTFILVKSMNIKKSTTLKEIATKAGVSPSTVSRVMNHKLSVRPEIRSRVERVIQELKYERNRSSGVRKSFNSNIVGLIVPDILNPFFPLLIKGIENIAKIHGYSLILCDSENDCEIEKKHIRNLLEKEVEGLIFIPAPGENDLIDELIEKDFPLVFLDRRIENKKINYVTAANEEGAYQATKYLISLGHRDIVYITAGAQYLSTQKERFDGFRRALEEEKIPFRNDLVIAGEHEREKTSREVIKLLNSGKKFTALFASSDIMAFAAKQVLEDRNLRIPDDVSIIGFDDIPFSSAISLTTVSQPAHEMGKNAMLLLIDLIKKRVRSPNQIVLRTSMIIRSSCKKR
jgi:LacI family transcriptional regulator